MKRTLGCQGEEAPGRASVTARYSAPSIWLLRTIRVRRTGSVHCIPWHAEVIREGDEVFVRESQASGCPGFQELIREDVED